jgi:hypothetical protein
MDDKLSSDLKSVLLKTRITWGVVLAGMIGLIVVSITLYSFNVIDHLPIVHPKKADNITLFVILALILAIFYIKQTILSPAKLIEKSKKQKVVLNFPYADFLQNDADEKRILFLKCIQILDRNMLIVWFLADLVVLSAVVNFILAPILNKLIMYSVVGLFSLLINFPNFSLYKKIHRYIYE